MQRSRIRAAVVGGDTDIYTIRVLFIFRILTYDGYQYAYIHHCDTHLQENIPIAVLVEDISVKDLELGYITITVLVLLYEFFVWKGLLRILVQELHVRMRWGRIEIIVQLLDVFAMVPLMSSDTEEAFLQDTVLSVPQ